MGALRGRGIWGHTSAGKRLSEETSSGATDRQSGSARTSILARDVTLTLARTWKRPEVIWYLRADLSFRSGHARGMLGPPGTHCVIERQLSCVPKNRAVKQDKHGVGFNKSKTCIRRPRGCLSGRPTVCTVYIPPYPDAIAAVVSRPQVIYSHHFDTLEAVMMSALPATNHGDPLSAGSRAGEIYTLSQIKSDSSLGLRLGMSLELADVESFPGVAVCPSRLVDSSGLDPEYLLQTVGQGGGCAEGLPVSYTRHDLTPGPSGRDTWQREIDRHTDIHTERQKALRNRWIIGYGGSELYDGAVTIPPAQVAKPTIIGSSRAGKSFQHVLWTLTPRSLFVLVPG
ncbi:hypothetical protein EGW08_015984 [Elysia chlorotica]|uniref:Uncharacterized protein n=1 Tax=Elysia chlorotica TaxID=188477 RepID=A0A433T3Y3_ELYCH|nr:hypothetical protein EGW08_015984 [Elysia chlorotica]